MKTIAASFVCDARLYIIESQVHQNVHLLMGEEPSFGDAAKMFLLRPKKAERRIRRRMINELNFPPNFEGLVLGCTDADFCK